MIFWETKPGQAGGGQALKFKSGKGNRQPQCELHWVGRARALERWLWFFNKADLCIVLCRIKCAFVAETQTHPDEKREGHTNC